MTSNQATAMSVLPKAVVAFAGARDSYQLPLALHEAGLLQSLVTDLYWPADRPWFASSLGRWMPREMIAKRYCDGLASEKVRLSTPALGAFTLMSLAPDLALNWYKGKVLSEKARRIALREDAALFCYTTCAFKAFRQNGDLPRYRFLFLLQADPRVRRRILEEEIERTPIARESLLAEHEFSLPEEQFRELYGEPHLANGWVASSSFAAQTLANYGIDADKIHVVPYGVNSEVFVRRSSPPSASKPFEVAYVGRLAQSKGLTYLCDAIRLLNTRNIRLVLYTMDTDQGLLSAYSDLNINVRRGLTGRRMAEALHNHDIFVFPSLAEGFGHVVLETMSCGLPLIATTHTCAPDVMIDGTHGFIVPIRDAEAIAEKLVWGIDHREELAAMGETAATQARSFTWPRFKAAVREAYKQMVAAQQT